MLFNLLLYEHKQEAYKQQSAGQPYGMNPEHGDEAASDTCANRKQEDYAEVVGCFIKYLPVVCSAVCAEGIHAASEISDTHGARIGVAVHLAEGLNLHCAGEGDYRIGYEVHALRHETYEKEQYNFKNQHKLSPMYAPCILVALADELGSGDTECKKYERDKIVYSGTDISLKEMLA